MNIINSKNTRESIHREMVDARPIAINILVEQFAKTDNENIKLRIAHTLYTRVESSMLIQIALDKNVDQREILRYGKKQQKKIDEVEQSNKRVAQERRHQKKGDYSLTDTQWEETLEHFDNNCAYCGEGGQMTYEHFIPFSRGGPFTKGNIIPVCQFCNCSKKDKEFNDWYRAQQFYSPVRELKVLDFVNNNKQFN